jgi:hypothetical protein
MPKTDWFINELERVGVELSASVGRGFERIGRFNEFAGVKFGQP